MQCCFMQARAKILFFFPLRLSRSAALRVTVSRLQPKIRHTHFQSPTTAFAFNITLSQVENACNKQDFCRMHVASVLLSWAQDAAGGFSLPLILRPLSVMAATHHWRGEKKNGSAGEREKNSQWLMASGIKRPHLHHWTIHYCEVDILLCQPMVLNEGCRYGIQVLAWKELGQFGHHPKP